MSEADNHKNSEFPEPVNFVNSTEAERANPSFLNSPDDEIAPGDEQAYQGENQQEDDSTSWVEMTEDGFAVIAPEDLAEIVALTQELRSSNSNLIERVTELSQALSESHKALQWYKQRSQAHELMLNQQQKELATAQEQVKHLFYELEASHQTAQRQQILIETLTDQLEISQERVAHLERECAVTQQRYNEQSYQLVQTENTCRDLRNRLTRQQRQTLQLKVALEKCLEVPVPSYQLQADTDLSAGNNSRNGPHSSPYQLKAQPIPPWSAQPEPTNKLEPAWDSVPSSSMHLTSSTWAESATAGASAEVELVTTAPTAAGEPPKAVESYESNPKDSAAKVNFSQQPPSAALPESNLEEMDAAMQRLYEPPTAELPPTTDAEQFYPLVEDMDDDLEAQWQAFAGLLEDDEEPVTVNSPEGGLTETVGNQAAQPNREDLQSRPYELQPTVPYLLNTTFEQVSPHAVGPPQSESSSFTPITNWPAPVVYPLRPPKGRKSLAAVELPTFRLSQSE